MITLSKIAKLAHVSVSTASKAFSGSNEVNEETRNLIFDIAKQHGCFKKFFNAKYSKFVIAVICPEFNSKHYTQYLSCIQEYLERENCEICVATTSFSEENEKNLIEYYYRYSRVDGIIVINSNSKVIYDDNYEIPIVFINSSHKSLCRTSISTNIEPAIFESIEHLKRNNVTSIGFIGEKRTASKLLCFEKAMKSIIKDFNEDYISISDERFEAGGYAAMEKLFKKTPLPRAIVCAYDYMAIGAIRCIYDHGLTVPNDIAVLGMDNIPEAEYLNPPLASISSHTKDLCRAAVKAVIEQINGEENDYCEPFVAKFHLRKSFEIT